jgi:hypothetical protein
MKKLVPIRKTHFPFDTLISMDSDTLNFGAALLVESQLWLDVTIIGTQLAFN